MELTTRKKFNLHDYLFTPINNGSLVLFRILFGFVMTLEFVGAQVTGWITEVFVATKINFPFIGFEFLQKLHGPIMYWYYGLMALCSILVCIGLFFRPASILMAILWTGVYLSQKNHYNNHYYLMVLLSWMMTITPANRRASLDVKFGFVRSSNTCYRWYITAFIAQIWIMYTFAAIAKVNSDWLRAMPLKLWFGNKSDVSVVGKLFGQEWFAWAIAYLGLLFDLLITPALLWKRTRALAVGAMFFFHFFNSAVFGIGSFPYMAMSLAVFFYPGSDFDNLLKRSKNELVDKRPSLAVMNITIITLCVYMLWQLVLPIRHHFIEGDVNWTEEGHRMAWRMMLRSKSGNGYYIIKDKNSDKEWKVYPKDHLLSFQKSDVTHHPDMIWQFAQYLEEEYQKKGYDVGVYANCYCSLNGGRYSLIVDPEVDLAAEEWEPYKHHEWLMPRPPRK